MHECSNETVAWPPDSILCSYLRLSHGEPNNYKVLKQIVNNATGETPPPNATVVHLRLGDALKQGDDCWDVESDCLHRHGAWKRQHPNERGMYAYPKTHYESILVPQPDHNHEPTSGAPSPHLIIVCSLKHGNAGIIQKSITYLDKFTTFAEGRGYTVTQRIDAGTADQDLIYMVNAARFIKGGGGFSDLIESIRNTCA